MNIKHVDNKHVDYFLILALSSTSSQHDFWQLCLVTWICMLMLCRCIGQTSYLANNKESTILVSPFCACLLTAARKISVILWHCSELKVRTFDQCGRNHFQILWYSREVRHILNEDFSLKTFAKIFSHRKDYWLSPKIQNGESSSSTVNWVDVTKQTKAHILDSIHSGGAQFCQKTSVLMWS